MHGCTAFRYLERGRDLDAPTHDVHLSTGPATLPLTLSFWLVLQYLIRPVPILVHLFQ
jgi:hypothetical protein